MKTNLLPALKSCGVVGGCIWIITSALGPGLVKCQMSSGRLGKLSWCIWIIASALGPGLVKSQMSSARLGQPGSRPRPSLKSYGVVGAFGL